ncbi:MAG: TetR/AcrR family transcriptional regulator [Candidatus Ornithomonoglobus sp.]
MKKTDTKEKILNEALKLFAAKGYEAVGVAEIADAVGIKAPSLYKHYKNKRAIFDSIIERVNEMDTEQAGNYEMPEGTIEETEAAYKNIPLEKIKAYTKAMLLYWTEEEFSRNFRKLLTLEQYKNPEMGRLYQQYISGGPVQYMADVLAEMTSSEREAYQLALEFYGPMYLLYSIYDGTGDKDRVAALLEGHIESFLQRLEQKYIKKYNRQERF